MCEGIEFKENFLTDEKGALTESYLRTNYYNDKSGKIIACLPAISMALFDPDFCKHEFGILMDKGQATQRVLVRFTGEWRDLDSRDITRVRIYLEERGFSRVKKEDVRDIIEFVAKSHPVEILPIHGSDADSED